MDFAVHSNPHAWRQDFDGCRHPLSEGTEGAPRLMNVVSGGLGFIGKSTQTVASSATGCMWRIM